MIHFIVGLKEEPFRPLSSNFNAHSVRLLLHQSIVTLRTLQANGCRFYTADQFVPLHQYSFFLSPLSLSSPIEFYLHGDASVACILLASLPQFTAALLSFGYSSLISKLMTKCIRLQFESVVLNGQPF